MEKPQSAQVAAILLLIGGCWSLIWALSVTGASLLLWFPAWIFGIPAAIIAIVAGARRLGDGSLGLGVPKLAAILEIIQIINCDAVGMTLGIVALVFATKPESVAWFTGDAGAYAQSSRLGGAPGGGPAPVIMGAPLNAAGLLVETSFFPLAWLFYMCTPRIVINGAVEQRPWGKHHIPLAPGNYHLEIFFPYITSSNSGYAAMDVQVAPGMVTRVTYYKDTWMWTKGKMKIVGQIPVAGGAPAAAPGPAAAAPTFEPPAGGGQPPPGSWS